MSVPKKLNTIITSHTKHSDNGLLKDILNLNKHKEDIEDIISIFKTLTNEEKSHIQEFLQINNLKNYKHKLNLLKNNIQIMKLLKILDLESTLKEEVLKPFWKGSLKEKYKKLWFPIETDLQDVDLNSSNLYLNGLNANSQLYQKKNQTSTETLLMTSFQLSQFTHLDTMEVEKEKKLIKSRKIRILPTKFQKEKFNEYFNTSRYIWNLCVEYINKEYNEQKETYDELNKNGCVYINKDKKQCCNETDNNYYCKKHIKRKLKWNITTNSIKLRNKVLINDKDLPDNLLWLKGTPYDTKELMIRMFCGNLKTAIRNKNNGFISSFNFKRKKDNFNIFYINKKAINSKLELFRNRFKTEKKLKTKSKNRNKLYNIDNNCIIQKINNKYYLIILKETITKYEKPKYDTVSLDPGVRSFQYCYSPNGVITDIKPNFDRLERHIKYIERLVNLKSNSKLKRKISILRTKIRNYINDFHYKTINYLVKNYNNIVIPQFGVKNMVKKKNRNISKKTVKDLLILSHGSFIEKLKFKCDEYQRRLILTSEEFTTKTCGNCGNLKNDIGSNKMFKCDKCNSVIGRDCNGSRNILLKLIS